MDGTLVVLIRDFQSNFILRPGVYFAIKVGLNCVRFNQIHGEITLDVGGQGTDPTLEMFVFERRPRLKNSTVGRRRDLLDRGRERYYKRPVSQSGEFRVEWKSIEVKLPRTRMTFIMDIEFYPRVPILPHKNVSNMDISSQKDRQDQRVKSEERDGKQRTTLNDVKGQTVCENQRHRKETPRETDKVRKRDRIKSALAGFKKENKEQMNDGNTIYYDLSERPHPLGSRYTYQHGDSLSLQKLEVPSNVMENDIGELVRPEGSEQDTLPVDVTPQAFFNDASNRLKFSERLNFLNAFSSDNTRLTSYLGNGKWSTPLLSDAGLTWYLQPGVEALPNPALPPKCPKGMLWEEYYLLNQELYTRDVLR